MSGDPPCLLRGGWRSAVPLAPYTTWRIGGEALWSAEPLDREDLRQLARWRCQRPDLPWLWLGGGSNLLVDDRGFPGVVVVMTRHLKAVTPLPVEPPEGGWLIRAEAGAMVRQVAHLARRLGGAGLEFLGGIPGSVGGAVRMNAGAYGGDISSVLVEALVMDPEGEIHRRSGVELGFGYRRVALPADWVVVEGIFRTSPGDPGRIAQAMRAMNASRRFSQPLGFPSAGSTFKNPPSSEAAWRLIDQAGMRGVWQGGAQVSTLHCNFLLNRGGATASDMMGLIDRVREAVVRRSGVTLELEVGIVGFSRP